MASDLTCRIGESQSGLYSWRPGNDLAMPVALAQAQPQEPQPKPATKTTIELNKSSTAGYPWSDTTDFRNAKRGFIAAAAQQRRDQRQGRQDRQRPLQVRVHQAGPGCAGYGQSQPVAGFAAVMNSGLFEVVPGVYQVRGADLAEHDDCRGRYRHHDLRSAHLGRGRALCAGPLLPAPPAQAGGRGRCIRTPTWITSAACAA